MSIYTRQYIGEEKKVCSEYHSPEEFEHCTQEVIDKFIEYDMNFEEMCAVFEMIKDKVNATNISIRDIMKLKKQS